MSTTRPARHRWFDHAPVLDAANTVVIDESGANQPYDFTILLDGNGFDVNARGRTDGDQVFASDQKLITLIGSDFDDTFTLTVTAVPTGALMDVSGGDGTNRLAASFAVSTSFILQQDGTYSSNIGTFSDLSSVSLILNAGSSTIVTGAFNDQFALNGGYATINSGAGDDTFVTGYNSLYDIDGGTGYDKWNAYFSARTSTPTGIDVRGSMITIENGSGGSGIEELNIGAAGPLNLSISGQVDLAPKITVLYTSSPEIHANLDYSGSGRALEIYASGTRGDDFPRDSFGLTLYRLDEVGLSISRMRELHVIGSSLDDVFHFNVITRNPNLTTSFDGGLGQDILYVNTIDDYYGYNNKDIIPNAVFVVDEDGAIESNFSRFSNFERFEINVGDNAFITAGRLDDLITGGGTLIGGDGNDALTASYANAVLEGGTGDDMLLGDVNTTASYHGSSAAVSLTLIAGAQDTGGAGIDTLSNIKNLTGSDFNDHLTGDGNANVLEGGRGNDLLDGGLGLDTASYAGALSAVRVDLAIAGAQKTAGAGQDTLVSIENLTGSAFDDVLAGNASDNVLAGGLGYDIVSYAGAIQGVTVDLRVVGAQDTGYGRDTLSGFEAIVGSVYNDTLNGDFQDNILEGGAGDDTLDGTTGVDTASYAHAAAGVTVSLALTTAQDTGGAGVDTLRNIEALAGSAFADVLGGGALGDRLSGGDGDDRLTGAGGADTLDGGVGVDTAVYTGGPWAQYDVVATADGYEITRIGAPDNHDTLTAVERVSFDEQTFDIADTVNVGPKGRGDHGGDLREAADGDKGVSSARGNVLASDRDANLATPELGEALHVSAAGVVPSTFLQVTDEVTIQGRYGTLLIEADGSYRYKLDNRLPATDHLDAGDVGRERFFYEVSDVHGATSLARVIFLIAGADDAGHPASPAATPFDPVSHDWPLSADGQMYV